MDCFRDDPNQTVPLQLVDKNDYEALVEGSDPFLQNFMAHNRFEASFGQTLIIPNRDGAVEKVLLGTQGWPEDPRGWVLLGAKAGAGCSPTPALHLDDKDMEAQEQLQFYLGWGLASYRFGRYLSKEAKPKAAIYVPETVNRAALKNQLEAVFLARDLVNTPAEDMGPAELAGQAMEIAEEFGAEVQLTRGKELLEANYPAIYAVGKGSHRPPTLIDLRWGNPDHPKLSLVGKGVVFDAGGLDLKGATSMRWMKKDMGGGAITLALAKLIMAEKLPVRLRLLIPAVENAAGPEAYRPGDVIQTRKGISVEIHNTDAEGRIVMCDALAEALTESPDLLINMATLTGAARVALGQDLPGFWTQETELARALEDAADEVADPVWRMPLWRPYRKMLNSTIADISNCATGPLGGAITAALYLHEFVKPFANWIHFDVFAWRNDAQPGSPKGGEASALRAVFRFLEKRYRD
ncbi:leucyl aminopeptidase family protein [Acanthopleuribacter pedis]|uniref:Leucyl aminopeptidase family protein n=1 Tax=Acanthopleuribacter pedis TaxID=442870 RepID=A0A8J7U3Q2_9BACT|nr:leucyl aminopeptidase family protein [Acanthopleuribacter pedis]MBO1319004.1 leucyl aminopeptidase family protein [Acanthopleuribacter pedis]